MFLSLWICLITWIFTSGAQDFRPGVCPPNPKSNKQCSYVSDECKNDSNCPGVQKCCPNECTANSCKDPLLKDRPGCPPFDPDLRCIQFIQQCNSDNDCKKDELCCFQPACGTSCTKKISDDKCPPYRKDVLCKRYINNCDCNSDCPKGQLCCTVECGKDCKTPKPDVECPLIKCIGLPPGVCSRDTYKYIAGKKCKLCPEIIPCDKDCLLPPKVGQCKGKHPRYYYDVNSQSCQKFYYGGCDGNANNFWTLEDCLRECATGPIGTCPTVKCAPPPSDVCTEDVFIIVDGKICKGCPKIVPCKTVCSLPKKPGTCYAYVPRYYYNTETKSCEQFIYGGCNGNANNFETLQECNQKCDCNPNICSLPRQPGPCKAYFPRYYYDTTTNKCEKFIYGGCQGNANNFETLEECQQKCGSNPNVMFWVCNLPKQPGPCKAYMPRYYYDPTTKSCEKFIYGGCQGNANNFETLEECKQKCDSNTNVCDLPKKVGPCEAAIPRYYYDKATQACQKFIYGGCQGNANNFETLDECKRRCDKNSNVCDLPKDTGPCRGSFQRYYFDTTTKTCKTFIYGGCQGNANNFNTLKECQTKCGVTPIKCGPVCLIFCEFGNVLDENGCPTCKCKPDPCSSAPKCAIPGPGVCFEPTYKMIDGVKCHWCYQIVPCKPEGLLKCPTDLLSKYACANYKMTCSSDSSCPKGQKCCKQDCGFRCVHGV